MWLPKDLLQSSYIQIFALNLLIESFHSIRERSTLMAFLSFSDELLAGGEDYAQWVKDTPKTCTFLFGVNLRHMQLGVLPIHIPGDMLTRMEEALEVLLDRLLSQRFQHSCRTAHRPGEKKINKGISTYN